MSRTERRSRATDAAKDAARTARDNLAEQWEERLALPVIIAALVSIPAVFLTMTDSPVLEVAGHTLNWASLVVLAGEAVLLFIMTGHKRAWLKRHWWAILLTVIAVPAVIFAVAPVQALRLLNLVKIIGTLRILRANTIVSAGRILARRFGLAGPWRYALVVAGSLVAAGFVAIVLVDPTSARQHEQLINEVSRWTGIAPALVAGVILAAATFIVVLYRRRVPAAATSTSGEAGTGDGDRDRDGDSHRSDRAGEGEGDGEGEEQVAPVTGRGTEPRPNPERP